MKKKTSRIEKEKLVVKEMIELYCKKKEKNKELCEECKSLLDYAYKRLDHCKFGEYKSSCQKCPIHCYKKDMRASYAFQRSANVVLSSGCCIKTFAPEIKNRCVIIAKCSIAFGVHP